ncbi:RidA family protein [Salinirubrum litoreum]|uniref:RidA family protein n=1 Tax=Salinirubrum litoreum TaxID=1126234 RepID=A0ABD5RAZ8_9EURY
MRKTVLAPGFADSRAEGVPHVVIADGVVTHHADHDRVLLSGAGAPGETVAEQVTELFLMLDALLSDIDGSIDDVVTTRYHVLAEQLDRETQADVDAVRAEFFEYPHYPASTMVGVADLLGDEMLVEVEIEAVIPRETRADADDAADAESDEETADATEIRDRREPLTTVLTREGESLTVEDARAREGLDDRIEIEFETVEESDDQ